MPTDVDQDNGDFHPPKTKKRRLPGACDACRKKRVKCNSAEMPNNVCSNCIATESLCLHHTPYKKQEVENYIAYLEQRNQTFERVFRELQVVHPERDLLQEVNSAVGPNASSGSLSQNSVSNSLSSPGIVRPTADPLSTLGAKSSLTDLESDPLSNDISKRLSDMKFELADDSFFGGSSHFTLMSQAMAMKEPSKTSESTANKPDSETFKRDVYWTIRTWEKELLTTEPQNSCQFPPVDLLESLVSLYLTHVNSFYPLFHRPTMERQVKGQLYIKDPSFGKLVLAMCAVGSRYSNDPRVLFDAPDGSTLSAGYQWFSQVPLVHTRYFFDVLSLADVQTICIAMFYVFGTSLPRGCWTLVGFGLRACQERGIDKRLPSGGTVTKTVEDELWKRAFWLLVLLDRQLCTFSGRPTAVSSEDIEIDWPEECDDEFWEINHETGQVSFHQPHDKPSLLTGFLAYLRLCELYAVSMRTLYASPRSRAIFGVSCETWEKRVVTELDSSLNLWLDNVPDHLRWDPTRENSVHFDQSCLLYIIYYGLQIQIHRPFIHRKDSTLAFPSLAICTNSARGCCRILDTQVRRGSLKLPPVMIVANIAAYILLMTIYSAKKFGLEINPAKELENVRMAMSYLQQCEKHWHIAGRFYDLINEMASTELSFPTFRHTATKRGREEMETQADDDATSSFSNSTCVQDDSLDSIPPGVNGHALVALVGSKPLSRGPQAIISPTTSTHDDSSFTFTPSPTESNNIADWNINPYAFPSFPSTENNNATTLYPEFHIDPSLSAGSFGLEELERLSNQMISTTFPTVENQFDWDSAFGPPATEFPMYLNHSV